MNDGFGFEDAFSDNVDLTPLIDVIFLLLLFFILATTFLKPVVDVTLPSAESGVTASKEKQMVVTIDRQGRVFYEQALVERRDLPALLGKHPELPLNFMIDGQAPFQSFMDVLDQARIQGRENFVITTDPGDAEAEHASRF
ncbi:MAG: ExbD/TolR family protein [Desulfovibrio sp.]